MLPGYAPPDLLVMKTNVSSANDWAVANGTGIGVFATYACALGGKMIPPEVEFNRSLIFGYPIIHEVAVSRGYGTRSTG
jgi:hypothetical protein